MAEWPLPGDRRTRCDTPQNGTCDIGAFEFEGPSLRPMTRRRTPSTSRDRIRTRETRHHSPLPAPTTQPKPAMNCSRMPAARNRSHRAAGAGRSERAARSRIMWHGCPTHGKTTRRRGPLQVRGPRHRPCWQCRSTPDVHIFGGEDDSLPPNTFFLAIPANPSIGKPPSSALATDNRRLPNGWNTNAGSIPETLSSG